MIAHNKSSIVAKYVEGYSKLNDGDKNTFAIVCNKLLSDNFIYGQRFHDEDVYRSINRLRDVIENYFALIDFELIHDDNYKIFFLRSKVNGTRVKLKKLESVILLVLAKLYSTKSMDVGAGKGVEVNILTSELLDELDKTRIFATRLYKTDIAVALRTLKKYKIIDLDTTDINALEAIKVLPTILYVVTESDITCIDNRLTGLTNLEDEVNNVEGDIEDETDED